MRKFFLFSGLILLSACTGANDLVINEKNAPQDLVSGYSQEEQAISRINEINNGATPKVAPDSKKPAPPVVSPVNSSQNTTINPKTKDMNKAIITTNKGAFTIELDAQNAPITVENFKRYADSGYYNGTIFHRVMPGFMVQGGGFGQDGAQKATQAPIKNEAANGLKNNRGTVAMARTQIVDSATSQFFVNLVDNDFLNYIDDSNYGYAVFGQVVEGMEVVDAIAAVATGDNGAHQNWPLENVIIEKVELQ